MYNIYNARGSQKHTHHYSPLVASFGTLHCTVPCSPPTYRFCKWIFVDCTLGGQVVISDRVVTRIKMEHSKAELLSRAPQSAAGTMAIHDAPEQKHECEIRCLRTRTVWTNDTGTKTKSCHLPKHSCQEKCSRLLAFCILRLELLDCNLCGRLLCRLLPWLPVSLEISA